MDKKNIFKRSFAGLLSAVLLLSVLPVAPAAAENDPECICTPIENIHAETCPLYIPAGTDSTPSDPVPSDPVPSDPAPSEPDQTELTPMDPIDTDAPQTGSQAIDPYAETAPSMDAVIYTNKEYTVQDVDLSASTTLSGWDEDTNRYLKVSLQGLDPTASYRLVLYTDPAIYATTLDFTNQTWDDHQQTENHSKISVNKGGTYTPNIHSGTTTDTITTGTTGMDLNLELNYDWIFWDRSNAAPLGYYAAYQDDSTKPLIRVALQKVTDTDTTETLSTLSLDSATAGQIKNTLFTTQSQSILIADGSPTTTVNADQIVRFRLASFYNFMLKDLTYKVTLPHLEYNGTMYSMELAPNHTFAVKGGSANYTITEETTPEGVNTATFHFKDLYTTSNFRYIAFQLPTDPDAIQALEQAASSHQFTGGKIEIYRGNELYRTLSDISIEMVRSGINIIEYDKVSSSARRNKASLGDLGKIQYLDLFAAVNAGTNDSGPVTVHAEFDSNKKKAIGVTAMRLMAPKGSTLTIHYTMIDSEGTLHECPAPLTVKSTSSDDSGYLFTRADLPAPFNTYHFKTITYVTTFPAGVQLFDSDSLQSPDSGGTVWGEVLVSTVPSSANRSKNSFYVYDGDFLGKEFDSSKLLVSATRAVVIQSASIANQTASYGIYTPRVSLPGKSAGKSVELTPGDAAVITAQVKVAEYPYTARSAVKNLRIGVRLPLGVTINRADLSMTLANGTAVGIENISYTPVTVGDSTENLWLIELDPTLELGYYNEKLAPLPAGATLNLTIPIQTELTTLSGHIQVDEILYVAAYGQGQGVTGGNLKNYRTKDIYGMLGPCEGLSDTYKYVGSCRKDKPENVYIYIGSPHAKLNITDSFVGSEDGSMLTMKQFDETIQYKLDVSCDTGGTVSRFYYYIPIPKANCESTLDFVEKTSQLSLDLTGPASLSFSDSETPLTLLYTTDKNLTYTSAASANWVTEAEIPADGWDDVTMMKLVPSDPAAIIKNGSNIHVLASLRFHGDEQTYAQNTGAQFKWQSKGFYNYNLGVGAIQGTYPTEGVLLDLSYTAPTQKLTLTAAKDSNPSTPGAEKAKLDVNALVGGTFVNTPTFTIENIQTVGDVTLMASTTHFGAMTSAESNTKFAITAKLGSTTKDLIKGSTVKNMTVADINSILFTFEIFNGNVITENAQTKKVLLDLVGSNGLTVPVEITILRELAAAEPENPGILGGKQYSLFDDIKDSVTLRNSSAFTAQFVASLVPKNYQCPVLKVTGEPTGPLIMIDWTNAARPKYYQAEIPANGTLALTAFQNIDGSGPYVYAAQDTQVKQAFLFVFHEAGSSNGSIKLTQNAKEGENIVQTLSFTVKDDRDFRLSGGGTTVPGASVPVNYATDTGAPTGANDSHYQDRELSLILTGSDLPVDLYLRSGGKAYRRNPYGEFIIPLEDIQGAGNGSIAITPVTAVKDPSCTLAAELWASATDNGSKPHEGQKVAGGVTITVSDVGASPALKVVSMSDRMIRLSELSEPVTVKVQKANFGSNTKVEMSLQVKEGNGYADRAAVLDKQTGLTNSNGTDTMELQFNLGTAIGTYRLLFTITNGDHTVEIPYNFLVVKD